MVEAALVEKAAARLVELLGYTTIEVEERAHVRAAHESGDGDRESNAVDALSHSGGDDFHDFPLFQP